MEMRRNDSTRRCSRGHHSVSSLRTREPRCRIAGGSRGARRAHVGARPYEAEFLCELFAYILDGHNAFIDDGIERVLGRKARDFTTYAQDAAKAGAWSPGAVTR
jgi:hypothetical protein